jgi:hypothetical protein
MRIGIGLAFLVGIAASAQITPKDTVGPDHFWCTQADFYVAKDRTTASAWIDFYPGNRGWSGSVSCRTYDGTAIAPQDYDGQTNRLSLSYTHHPIAFTVPIHCVTNTPGEKTFNVQLFDPSGYPTGQLDGPSGATIHLLDNTNGNVSFAQTSQYVSRAGGVVRIRAVRTGTPNGAITVNFSTAPGQYDGYWLDPSNTGTAAAGTDFVATNGVLTFAPGQTEQSFDLTILPSDSTSSVWRILYLTEDYGPNFHIVQNRMTVVIVPPILRIEPLQTGAQISWTNCGVGFQLERCVDPTFSQCVAVDHTTNGNQCIAIDPIAGAAFYRLKH